MLLRHGRPSSSKFSCKDVAITRIFFGESLFKLSSSCDYGIVLDRMTSTRLLQALTFCCRLCESISREWKEAAAVQLPELRSCLRTLLRLTPSLHTHRLGRKVYRTS